MDLHIYQQLILKKLLYTSSLKFSDLQIESLTSKHFNYHLKQLMNENLIKKEENVYELTPIGKGFVGRLNDQDISVEKQPKVSVMIIPYKMIKGKRMMLVNKMLKQPYYGKVGDFTGKVRFGEAIEQAAKREFFEETGLMAQFKFAKCIRKIAYI